MEKSTYKRAKKHIILKIFGTYLYKNTCFCKKTARKEKKHGNPES